MKLRSVPYILRIYNGKRQNLMEELYSELLLFAPWRNEEAKNPWKEIVPIEDEDKKNRDDIITKVSSDAKEIVEKNKKKIYPFSKKLV